MLSTSISVPISAADPSQVGNARRKANSLAAALDFSDVRMGELSIVVTEAARNIATHAGEGQLVLTPRELNGRMVIDVFALDRGPGIADLERASEDGYSTAGTPGQGLGAMSRLADKLQIYTLRSGGTALFARVFGTASYGHSKSDGAEHGSSPDEHARPVASDRREEIFSLGVISVPIAGETVCGDAWSCVQEADRSIYIVADGLGHGPYAAEAAEEAIRVFHTMHQMAPERILKEIHGALAKTRGAAVSIAEIRHKEAVVNYTGAGNVVGAIHTGGKSRNMVSMNGTVGHSVAKLQQFSYPWERNSMLIMHSDGLTTRWSVEQYTGLATRHPAVVAGVLYRDFTRGRDDATVLVSRG